MDALAAGFGQIVVIGQHAPDGSRILLTQQQFGAALAADLIGRANLVFQRLALALHVTQRRIAIPAGGLHAGLLAVDVGLQGAHGRCQLTNPSLGGLELRKELPSARSVAIHLFLQGL